MKTLFFVLALCLAVANARTNVTFYYESLCPFCQQEMNSQVPLAVKKFPDTEIFFNMQPFGNARANANGDFDCQHGETECVGNAWMACYINQIDASQSSKYAQYATCTMSHYSDILNFVEACAGDLAAQTKKCVESKGYLPYFKEYYQNIQAAYAMIDPNQRGVPLVLIDGVPNLDTDDLVTAICKYAKVKPSAC